MRKPGVSIGTRNIGACPARMLTFGLVRASTKNSLATLPLAMKHLLAVEYPLVAVALGLQRQPAFGSSSGGRRWSEPAFGSVPAWPSRKVSSAMNGFRKRSFWSVVQNSAIRWLHFQHWLKVLAIALSPLREFGDHQRLRHEIDAVAAPFLGHRRVRKPSCEPLLDDVPVEGLARIGDAVARQRQRPEFFLGEFARLEPPRALFFVQ